jgi:DNA-binding transcriptional LysR family regulator
MINNGQALLTAALAGLGILLQPAALVQDEVNAGVWSGCCLATRPSPVRCTSSMHPNWRVTPKLRSFIDFAVARFGGLAGGA